MKNQKRWCGLIFTCLLFVPQKVMSLGSPGATRNDKPSPVLALVSLLFGVGLICSGVMIIRNKKYGPEEGLSGNYIKGKQAVFWGIVQTFFGVILCCLGLRELIRTLIA